MSSELLVLVFGAFAASLATGAAGFAFGLIGMAIWLHVMPPARAVPLVVICSIALNLALIWRLRGSVNVRRLRPFVVGALVGVPLGVAALRVMEPELIRQTVGVLLVVYGTYMLSRPSMPILHMSRRSARVMDTGVGVLGGFMGGSTSLNGVFPAIWSGLRNWTPQEQRGVFQPFILLVHIYTLLWFGGAGVIGVQTAYDALWCAPFLVVGAYLGLQIFTRSSEAVFRRLLLVLFILSGVLLLL